MSFRKYRWIIFVLLGLIFGIVTGSISRPAKVIAQQPTGFYSYSDWYAKRGNCQTKNWFN